MKKLMNKKGFTLMEMLIVIAIIVILVVISVPTFSKQLTNANSAADSANMRAAKAVAATEYLAGSKNAGTYNYDAATGALITGTPEDYGKVSGNKYVVVEIKADGSVVAGWNAVPTGGTEEEEEE